MPSELFFTINFTISILISIIGSIGSLLTMLFISKYRHLRTLNNYLLCNTCLATLAYGLINILNSILGLNESLNGPFCSVRGYLYNLTIAACCHSKSIHAISHLFFALFSKQKYLLTKYVNRILMSLSWLIALLICLPPFFIENGYSFEQESRYCVISTKMYRLALYISIVSVLTPCYIIVFVYLFIFLHVYRSTRRIWAFNTNSRNHFHDAKREMKLMKQMFVEIGVLVLGGPIFFFLIICHWTKLIYPPDCLYLLEFQLMTLVAALEPYVQIFVNTQLRDVFIRLFRF